MLCFSVHHILRHTCAIRTRCTWNAKNNLWYIITCTGNLPRSWLIIPGTREPFQNELYYVIRSCAQMCSCSTCMARVTQIMICPTCRKVCWRKRYLVLFIVIVWLTASYLNVFRNVIPIDPLTARSGNLLNRHHSHSTVRRRKIPFIKRTHDGDNITYSY